MRWSASSDNSIHREETYAIHFTTTLLCLAAGGHRRAVAEILQQLIRAIRTQYCWGVIHPFIQRIIGFKQKSVLTNNVGGVVVAIGVYRVWYPNGYLRDLDSTYFTEDDGWDGMSTKEIFDLISQVPFRRH